MSSQEYSRAQQSAADDSRAQQGIAELRVVIYCDTHLWNVKALYAKLAHSISAWASLQCQKNWDLPSNTHEPLWLQLFWEGCTWVLGVCLWEYLTINSIGSICEVRHWSLCSNLSQRCCTGSVLAKSLHTKRSSMSLCTLLWALGSLIWKGVPTL